MLDRSAVEHFLPEVPQRIPNSASSATNYQPLSAPIGCETIGRTGVHRIRGDVSGEPFYAFCHADTINLSNTAQDAWTVILQRSEDITSFNRNYAHFQTGFGNIAGDHWIGLDRLREVNYNNYIRNNNQL